jgi:hypothetical protein
MCRVRNEKRGQNPRGLETAPARLVNRSYDSGATSMWRLTTLAVWLPAANSLLQIRNRNAIAVSPLN